MTNAECAATQAAIEYRCAGRRVLSREQTDTGEAKRQRLLAAGDLEGLRTLVKDLDAVLHRAPKIADNASQIVLNDTITRLLYARKGCGADLKPIISAASFDGQARTGTCPACSETFRFTPPLSDEEAAVREEKKQAALTAALA